MTTAARAARRRTLLRYVIGPLLVIAATAVALLAPIHPAALLLSFVMTVALAAWAGGWKAGMATTALSLAALRVALDGAVAPAHLIVFAAAAAAACALFAIPAAARRRPAQLLSDDERRKTVEQELTEARRAAAVSNRRKERVLPLAARAGLVLVVFVVYTNLSDVFVATLSAPSVLQPLILLLAIPVLRYHDVFRPHSVLAQPITITLAAYALLIFTSSIWARDTAVADSTLSDVLKSLLILVLVASLITSWSALRAALITVAGAAMLLSLMTLVQIAVDDPGLQFGGLAGVDEGHLFGDVRNLRPAGPIGDPNYYARVLLLAFPLAALLGVGSARRIERLAYAAGAAIIALAILFTYSRGGALALAAVAVLLVAVGRIRVTWRTVLAAVVAAAMLAPTTVGRRMLTIEAIFSTGSQTGELDASLDKRRLLLATGWRLFTDHPLFGVGAGNFGTHYPLYANMVGWTGQDYTPLGARQYPHNLYLEVAVETGVAGLLLFVGALALAVVTLYRSRTALLERGRTADAAVVTAIAIALAGYAVSSLFLHSGLQRYLWLFLGFAVAAVRLTHEPQPAEGREQA